MDSTAQKIGCIGIGTMGGAIMSRLASHVDARLLSAYDTDASRSAPLSRDHGIRIAPSPEDLAGDADIVIVAVKPDAVERALESVKGRLTTEKTIVSIAAGVSISAMEAILGEQVKIVRVMSNTPAMVGEGMSVLSPNGHVDEKTLLEVERIFSIVGRVLVLPERLMDAVTGLSGSGPAYVFTFIQALTDGGVKLGIPREKALL
ncbi:MAG: pyrroline-5-carboxylate reductase, partial [Chrysiogenales bacterium]